MNETTRLAVATRQAQWTLDDLAYELTRDNADPAVCGKVAEGLEKLAQALRAHATRPPAMS